MTMLATRFEAFHAANPKVYVELRRLALAKLDAGASRVGIAELFEVLRYLRSLRTGGDPFKLDNSFRAFYARLLMAEEPRLASAFEVRRSVSDHLRRVPDASPVSRGDSPQQSAGTPAVAHGSAEPAPTGPAEVLSLFPDLEAA